MSSKPCRSKPGLSNSEIFSGTEGSNNDVPNLSKLLSQYSKTTQEQMGTPPADISSASTPLKCHPDEASKYDTSSASDEETNQLFQEVRRKRVR